MEFGSEVERRREAVRLVDEQVSVAEVARRVERSRWWVHQWLNRYRADGVSGLEDRSRVPKTQPAKTSSEMVTKILDTRSRLEGQPEASMGHLSILAQMERDGWSGIPSESTIERILSGAGVTRHKRKRDRSTEVHLPLPDASGPGMLQQADWVQDRYLKGGIRFQSLQLGVLI